MLDIKMKDKVKENNSEKKLFEKNGYLILKDFLSEKEVSDLKNMLIRGYNFHLEDDINEKNISEVIMKHENCNLHDKLYEAFKYISSSVYFVNIGEKFSNFVKEKFNLDTKIITTGFAIGIKDSKRTAYDWHQEKPYYENEETIHLQFPMIYPCNEKNGTMSVLEGSQKQGYIKEVKNIKINQKSVNSFVPKNIDDLINIYPEKSFNMSIRDAGVFDQNIIHRTNKNSVNKVRFAGIIRLKII